MGGISRVVGAVTIGGRRARLRQAHRREARQRRTRRARRQAGQTLIIFALTFTVLLGLAGLAVDVARAYDLYAHMLRAAEAGALAAVEYMPNYYNTPYAGDSQSAISRASIEVIKNGFGGPTALASTLPANYFSCPNAPATFEVVVCPVTGKQDDLQVTVNETFNVILLSGLGVAPVRLSATAQANYLPPIQLGARLNYFGDEVECSATNPPDPTNTTSCPYNSGSNHLQGFLAAFNGPGELKENGDPMVYCEEGPSETASAADLDGSSYGIPIYDGSSTNHKQWSTTRSVIAQHCGQPVPGGNPGNPDYQPPGYDGPATHNTVHPGGYNYAVTVPAGITEGSIWVFNPSFIAGSGLDYVRTEPSMLDPNGNGIASTNGHLDAPPFYYNTTYTLYAVTATYDRSSDVAQPMTLVPGSTSLTFPAYDGYSNDVSLHGCSGSSVAYDPFWQGNSTQNSYFNSGSVPAGGCVDLSLNQAPAWRTNTPPPCFMQWCELTTHLGPGTYRLVIEATGIVSNTTAYTSTTTDGTGTSLYALKICPTSAIATPVSCGNGAVGSNPGVSLYGWNNMDISVESPLQALTPSSSNPATACAQTNGTPYTCIDLACIPTSYAGRLVILRIFDLGDGSGDLYAGVVAPAGSTASVVYEPWAPLSTQDGDSVVHTHFSSPSYSAYNGLWLDVTLQLPATYTGNCLTGPTGTGWWQMIYANATGANPGDWVGISFTLVGSPVHLVGLG